MAQKQTPVVVKLPDGTYVVPGEGESIEQAIARRQAKTPMDLQGPGGQRAGLNLPGAGEVDPEPFREFMGSLPQIGGMIAQMTAPGKTLKGAMLIPMLIEAVTQKMQGKDIDIGEMAAQAGMGGGARVAGKAIEGTGKFGKKLVTEALFGGSGTPATRATVDTLPNLAIKEKARMTFERPGQGKVKGSADDMLRKSVARDQMHLPPKQQNRVMQAEADQLEQLSEMLQEGALRSASKGTVPQIRAGGGMAGVAGTALGVPTQATAALSPVVGASISHAPAKLATGSALAAPFGLSTEHQIAPTAEMGLRTLLAYLSAQLEDPAHAMEPIPSHDEQGNASPREPVRRAPPGTVPSLPLTATMHQEGDQPNLLPINAPYGQEMPFLAFPALTPYGRPGEFAFERGDIELPSPPKPSKDEKKPRRRNQKR